MQIQRGRESCCFVLVFGLSSSPVLPGVRAVLDYVRTTAAADCRLPRSGRPRQLSRQADIETYRRATTAGSTCKGRRPEVRDNFVRPTVHRDSIGPRRVRPFGRVRIASGAREAARRGRDRRADRRGRPLGPKHASPLGVLNETAAWVVKAQCSLLAATPGGLLQAEPRRHVPLGPNARPAHEALVEAGRRSRTPLHVSRFAAEKWRTPDDCYTHSTIWRDP